MTRINPRPPLPKGATGPWDNVAFILSTVEMVKGVSKPNPSPDVRGAYNQTSLEVWDALSLALTRLIEKLEKDENEFLLTKKRFGL